MTDERVSVDDYEPENSWLSAPNLITNVISASTSQNYFSQDQLDIYNNMAEQERLAFAIGGIDENLAKKVKVENQPNKITAEIYFDQIKQGLTEAQQEELESRLQRLTYTLELAHKNEQISLKHHIQREIAIVCVKQKAAIAGYGKFVSKETIDKFINQVELARPKLYELSKFPRVIPEEIIEKINECKSKNLFDAFWVLSWNPKKEDVDSIKDRVIKKDPICFGSFMFDPDTYYYICDWIDEICDLTMDKMIDEIHKVAPDYKIGQVKPLQLSDLETIVDIARKREKLISKVNVSNYKNVAVIEDLKERKFNTKEILSISGILIKNLFKRKSR